MTEQFFRRVFLTGALWNVGGGLLILGATDWIFSTAGLQPPSPPAYYHSWIALFMVFGLGYFLVARDLYRNRDIALLGSIGKLAFSAVFLYNLTIYPGQVPQFFLIPVIGDVIFAVLFLAFFFWALRRRTA